MIRADAVARLAAAITEPPVASPIVAENWTVASVNAGGSLDGAAAVSITRGGNTIIAPYLASYTPAVGHMVRVEFDRGSPLILGRIIGLPVV
jgi:hypothetical protein